MQLKSFCCCTKNVGTTHEICDDMSMKNWGISIYDAQLTLIVPTGCLTHSLPGSVLVMIHAHKIETDEIIVCVVMNDDILWEQNKIFLTLPLTTCHNFSLYWNWISMISKPPKHVQTFSSSQHGSPTASVSRRRKVAFKWIVINLNESPDAREAPHDFHLFMREGERKRNDRPARIYASLLKFMKCDRP